MRIAYFITSYRSPDMLLRLLRTLRRGDPDATLVVHHDRFRSNLDEPAIADVGGVHLLQSDHPIVWGDLTLDRARWRVLEWMLANAKFDWVVLLSEQDYPLRPLADLPGRLSAGGADAVIDAGQLALIPDGNLRREYQRRYLYSYAALPRLTVGGRVPRAVRRRAGTSEPLGYRALNRAQDLARVYSFPDAMALPTKIGLRPRRSPFGADFPCWVGSSWFAMSRVAVQHLSDYLREHPEFVRHYERTIIPIESATATILCNDPKLTVRNEPLHHVRWSNRTTGRPDVYGTGDLQELLASGLPFARKFGPDDELLDRLDRHVLGQGAQA